MDPIYGIHVGLVVSDVADPERRHRVQVFVPHLSNTLYTGFNKDSSTKDISFKGPTDLPSGVWATLKTSLPWAEPAAHFFGGSGGLANSSTGFAATPGGSTYNKKGYGNVQITASNLPLSNLGMSVDGNNQELPSDNTIVNAHTTQYSFGRNIGGPDLNHDSGTNAGKGNYGKQVLGPGAAAVSSGLTAADGTPIKNGTILYNPLTNQKVMVVDTSGTGNNVDVWTDPTLYGKSSGPDYQNWKVVGSVSSLPENNGQLQSALGGYQGEIPAGYSAAAWLAAGNNGNIGNVPGTELAYQPPSSPSTNLVKTTDRAGAAAVPTNIGGNNGVGTFSTPGPGTKVYVFFLGGDIQRPVYFAKTIDPEDAGGFSGVTPIGDINIGSVNTKQT